MSVNRRSVLPVRSSPAASSCSASGEEKDVRVKLTMGRKAEGSPLEMLVDKNNNFQDFE